MGRLSRLVIGIHTTIRRRLLSSIRKSNPQEVLSNVHADRFAVLDEVTIDQVLSRLIQTYQPTREKDGAFGSFFGGLSSTMAAAFSYLHGSDWTISSLSVVFELFFRSFEELNLLSHQTLVGRQTLLVLVKI
jgi:hypothetical protein